MSMKELILELDEVAQKLKDELRHDKNGASVDEKWIRVFDMIILDIIDIRNVIDFATGKKDIDWEFVKKAIKKDLSKQS